MKININIIELSSYIIIYIFTRVDVLYSNRIHKRIQTLIMYVQLHIFQLQLGKTNKLESFIQLVQ